jgi:broad specificity phosphatase PhoE
MAQLERGTLVNNITQPKTIFIARHGESRANKTEVREGSESPLTNHGRDQANRLARCLSDEPITAIVTSDYVRAHDTALIVARALPFAPVQISHHFRERRNPSVMDGKPHNDPGAETIWDEIGKNYGTREWRHSDEENFADLHLRATSALELLTSLPDECIAVVSHGLFMKVVFAYVTLGDALTGRIFWDHFIPMEKVENTAIMKLRYAPTYDKTRMHWKLVSWNDSAHLD